MKFQSIPNFASSNYWLNIIEFKNNNNKKNLVKFINHMKSNKIEVTPIWKLNHLQNPILNLKITRLRMQLKLLIEAFVYRAVSILKQKI